MRQLDPLSLQTLIDIIPSPVFYKDAQERYLGCNRAFETALGLSREQIYGRTAREFAPRPLAEIFHAKDQELFEQRGTQTYETSLPFADGRLRTVIFNKATFSDEVGNVAGIVGVLVDISERKEAESRLAETLELVRKMVAAVPTGITVYHAGTGQCILCNPAMATILGGDVASILAQQFRGIDAWRDSGLLSAAEQALASGQDQRVDVCLKTTFGKHVCLSCVFTPFTSGSEQHLLLLADDITKQRCAEDARRASEFRYQTLTEKMGEGLISTNAAGRFTYCNPKFLRMLGYTAPEVLGRTFHELTFDCSYEAWQERLQQRRIGEGEQYEILLQHVDGTPVDVLVSAEPLFARDGTFAGTLGIVTDIRDRKRQEAATRQAHKVESLTALAGGVAHDFNNLFQTIQGNLEMGLRMLSDPERARRALERAIQSLDKAKVLSQRMLDYSGKSTRKSVPVDLADLIRMHAVLFSNLTASGTELTYQLEANLPLIEGDPEQLLQVMTALVANADEALEGRTGKIRFSLRPLSDAERAEGEWTEPPPSGPVLALSIADDGCGMPLPTQRRMFDPFFTTKEPGRGLGLASALGILKGHHAGLRYTSEPGRGTTFLIAFAAHTLTLEAPVPVSSSAILSQRKGFILLVDDDPGVRTTGAEMLKDFLDYQVLEARDGREAVNLFRQNPEAILAILMDATMPHMTGMEAFQAIKAIQPEARAILCSGYSDDTGHKLMQEHGFRGFLKKPYSIRDLKEALERAISAAP